jgi:regulation of enolase protein 1 (concanavalin A-like superfamily)
MRTILILLPLLLTAAPLGAEELVFQDDFKNGLAEGWKWVREDPKAWRSTPEGLEIRVLPGNMWGPPNNAKNVLVRPAPDPGPDRIEVSVKVENKPAGQYEQVDLVWYYNDSNMVKIGLEQVDKKLCVVMGREEKDRTRTIAVLPKGTPIMRLRLSVQGDKIRGHYRPEGATTWVKAGECTLPAAGKPKLSLQVYQGTLKVERWAKITEFRIRRVSAK